MNKILISIFTICIAISTFSQKVSSSEIQNNAKSIANDMELTAAERVGFSSVYTNKTVALQDIMSQNISAEEKAQKAITLLNSTDTELKKSLFNSSQAKYSNYYTKKATLSAQLVSTSIKKVDDVVNNQTQNTTQTTNSTANNDLNSYTKTAEYYALEDEYKQLLHNAAAQLNLNDVQFGKFTKDYVDLINGLQNLKEKYSSNILAGKPALDALLKQTENKVKVYLTPQQFTAYQTLMKQNALAKDTKPRVPGNNPYIQPGATTTTSNTNPTTQNNQNNTASITNANYNLSDVKATKVLTELKSSIGLSEIEYQKAMPILTQYDADIASIVAKNPNNPSAQQIEANKLNNPYANKLKLVLRPDRMAKFVAALKMQQNLVAGKMTPQQQALVDKMRLQYKMSDQQIIETMLILGETKLKADGIKANAIKNPQAATQATKDLLAEMDSKLKSTLTTEQYNLVKADLEAQLGVKK